MVLLLVYLFVALGVSFLCSLLEAVLLSISPSYEAALLSSKPKAGKRIEKLRDDIELPLSAILILNTVAHTGGAAGVGAQSAKLYGSEALTIASAILTLLVLVISEIIPKTLGATHWRRLATPCARILGWMVFGLYPLVVCAQALSRFISGASNEPTVSRAELMALAKVAHEEGIVDKSESRIVDSLLRFREVEADDIMTPREVIVAFDVAATVADVAADEAIGPFSRFPVYAGTLDNIVGFVLKHDLLLARTADRGDQHLSELVRPTRVLPQDSRLPALLDAMLRDKVHLLVIDDGDGKTVGIATLEDLVETLLGLEIVDETDTTIDMRKLARERQLARGEGRSVRER